MKKYSITPMAFWLLAIFVVISCNRNDKIADAYGTFEADEVTISSEVAGRIIELRIDEGDKVSNNQLVALIDTVQLSLKLDQLEKQVIAVKSKIPYINAQADVQSEQIKVYEVEYKRLKNMFIDGAATQKQIDDIEGRINLTEKQKEAIEVQRLSVNAEIESLMSQSLQLKDQLQRCKIINPVSGTVLVMFVNENEIVMQGKALYKVADMEYMYLKAYISGNQLTKFQPGNKVRVYVDSDSDKMIETDGVITWVSAESEFTPKIIQTKEERVKLVYPIKVKVKNEGSFRIGMPGEVRLLNNQD